MKSTNRIEKTVTLGAPVSRVWRAITDHREFGSWFGVELNGPFTVGKPVAGTFLRSFDESEIHEGQRQLGLPPSPVRIPQEAFTFCTVERIEPESYFSFHWIPFGIDAEIDPENEPTTLVEFTLEPTVDGTLLTIVESGFENVPIHRRQRAFLLNDGGWSAQAENLARYLEGI